MSDPFLTKLREMNITRSRESFGHAVDEWSDTDWATALAGEVGELCNYIKKERRGDGEQGSEIKKELADILIYLDLLAAKRGVDLQEVVTAKFNEVSQKRGSSCRL